MSVIYLLDLCCCQHVGCSFGLSDEPATDDLPMAVTDFHQSFTRQPEYSSSMFTFCSAELNAAASDCWQVCLTVEAWQSGRCLCLSRTPGLWLGEVETEHPRTTDKGTRLRVLNGLLHRTKARCLRAMSGASPLLTYKGGTRVAPDTSWCCCLQDPDHTDLGAQVQCR